MKTVHLLPGVREAIAGQLVSAYPREGCGALVGRIDGDVVHISEAVCVANVEPTRGQDRYMLDPLAYAALEESVAAGKDGSRIVGFFHSHPDGQPRPSNVDLEMARGLFEFARTQYVYAIQVVEKGSAGRLTFWTLADDGNSWLELAG